MKKYQVSQGFKFTLFLFFVSLLFFLLFLTEWFQFSFPKSVDPCNLETLRNKQYAVVTANECVTYEDGSKQGYHNCEGGMVGLTREYSSYTLKLGENARLRVGLYEKALISEVDSWVLGKGESPITIIGRVMRSGSGGIYLFQVTKEEVKEKYGIFRFVGGIGLCVSVLLFFSVGGIKRVYVKPLEDTKQFKDYFFGRVQNMERELEREKRVLEELQAEQKEHHKRFWIFLSVALFGLLLTICLGIVWLMGVNILTGIFLVIAAYVTIWVMAMAWHAFLNTDYPLAKKLSEIFLLRTCSTRSEEASKYIAVISKRLAQDAQEKERHVQDEGMEQGMWYGPGVWEIPKEENREDMEGTT